MEPNEKKRGVFSSTFHPSLIDHGAQAFSFQVRNFCQNAKNKKGIFFVTIKYICFFSEKFPNFKIIIIICFLGNSFHHIWTLL